MVSLNNKVVIITGASRGIGRKTAVFFAREGASVVLAARKEDALKAALENLGGSLQKHFYVPADISRDEDIKNLISKVMDKYGRIDILVNNAAISYVGRVKNIDLKKAEDVLNINLLGTIRVTSHVLPHMIRQKAGHIINISSILGKKGISYRSVYCASKFGVEGFMESLRSEVNKYNIKISMVRPPTVNTGFSTKIECDSDVTYRALGNMSPDTVAKIIVDMAKRPKREVNVGILAKGFLFLNRISPALFDRIVGEK